MYCIRLNDIECIVVYYFIMQCQEISELSIGYISGKVVYNSQ